MELSKQNVGRLLAIVLATLFLTSCGVFKNKSKSVSKFEVQESVQVEYVESEREEVLVKEKEVDKDVNTEVVEEITKKTTKGTNTSVTVKEGDFDEYGVAKIKDSEGRSLILKLDSLRKALEIIYETPEVIEENTTKTTRTIDKTKERERDSTDKVEKDKAVNVRKEYEEESKETNTKSKANFLAIIALCIGVAGGILLLIWGIRKILK